MEISSDAELTIECNPESLSEDKVRDLRSLGINRISLGVQSFQDVQLRRLERLSTRKHLYKAIEWIASHFKNFSLDLMVGLPDQSPELFERDLEEILKVNPPHISAYILTLKEDHVWKTAPAMKDRMIDDEQVESFYLRLIEQLRSAGFGQYEVSNFARPGFESRHNSNYWDVKSSYLGLGPGAHGYLDRVRYECVREPKAWMNSLSGVSSFERLTQEQQELEEFYMTLRTRRPANIADFRSAAIGALQQSGHILVNQAQGTFTLSDRGWLLMESVAERLLAQ